MSHAKLLNPEKALVFRITHVKNVPWILEHGLHCRASATTDPEFVPIGNEAIIEKRETRRVPVPPEGTLGDYVPWTELQHRKFTKDPEDPGSFERYQAEALAHRHVPPEGLLGVVCYTDDAAAAIERERAARRLDLKVLAREGWYF